MAPDGGDLNGACVSSAGPPNGMGEQDAVLPSTFARLRTVSGPDVFWSGMRADGTSSTAARRMDEELPLKRIALESDGQFSFVETRDIQCIEARGYRIVLHTSRDSHLLRVPLHALEARLPHDLYLRIHRSILVNSNAIREMQRLRRGEYVLTLANGQQYTSSAGYRHVVLEYLRRCRP